MQLGILPLPLPLPLALALVDLKVLARSGDQVYMHSARVDAILPFEAHIPCPPHLLCPQQVHPRRQ